MLNKFVWARYPSRHTARWEAREFPTISSSQLSKVFDVGGQYLGFVETKKGKDFVDCWCSRWIYFDSGHQELISAWVYTTTVCEFFGAPVSPEDVSGYRTTIVFRSEKSGKVIDGVELEHLYSDKPSRIEMGAMAEFFHIAIARNPEVLDISSIVNEVNVFTEPEGVWGRIIG